ncbi:MAG: sensor histidine kinase, partial [Candidatus Acidiferrales bacterium]
HPSQLEVLGLVPALRGFCADLSKQKGLPVEFKHEAVPEGLPPEVSLCLYRVVQEGLQNVFKHSGAGRAQVTLAGGPEALHLTVVDDGKGFDPATLGASVGLGLVSMRERARLARGEFSIHSQPGRGTRLEVRIPLTGLSS